jgi:hypothetical protein
MRKIGGLMKREAQITLSEAEIEIGQAFDALNADQVAAIRTEAGAAYERKHGKMMPANSWTYIRKRYDLLQRRARPLKS